jgi:ketosteroid isomerase-like protein
MGKMTFVTLMLLALPAVAAEDDKSKHGGPAETAVRATLDKADDAFNKGDAKALTALFDKAFFFGGQYMTGRFDADAAKADVEKTFANGPIGRLTRGDTTVHVDETGDAAWYIAEYMMVPKVGPGMLPVHRKMRESGVLVKHGKEWKLAMVHVSQLQPDPVRPGAPPPGAPATPPPPAK